MASAIKSTSRKIIYPSAERNKIFILKVLQKHIDGSQLQNFLEIASGTGQHVAYIAEKFPRIVFQPSEVDEELFESIKAYALEVTTKNVRNPLRIDVTTDFRNWNVDTKFDYILNINMFHVTPINCSNGFFKNGGKVLKDGGLMFTYGPYSNEGVLEPQSNVQFDRSIRRRDPNCGIRDIQELTKFAGECGIKLVSIYDLPANNKCLVWQKLIT